MSSDRKAIVVVVDRLSAGTLGPYGNTWLETPHLNQLASQSLLFEFAQSDSTSLERVYRSYWTGEHAITFSDQPRATLSLPELLSRVGVETSLITDDQSIDRFELSQLFSVCQVVPFPQPDLAASEVAHSALGAIMAAGMAQVEKIRPGELLWIHASGMEGPWDAPYHFRKSMADVEDPEPPGFVDPPARLLPADADPDEVLGVLHAYAGQVALLDACLGALLAAVDQQSDADTLFVLTSPRGFPLGEHGRIGAWDQSLYNESLSVPLFLRTDSGELARVRSHFLAQPPDLFETLLAWFGIPTEGGGPFGTDLLEVAQTGSEYLRDRACSVSAAETALRTPAWFLRQADQDVELYVKPDDRWEMNNVVQRCPQVVEAMQDALQEFEQAAETGEIRHLKPIANLLTERW